MRDLAVLRGRLARQPFGGPIRDSAVAIGISVIVVLGLGLAHELGFSHSVKFEVPSRDVLEFG